MPEFVDVTHLDGVVANTIALLSNRWTSFRVTSGGVVLRGDDDYAGGADVWTATIQRSGDRVFVRCHRRRSGFSIKFWADRNLVLPLRRQLAAAV